MSLADELMADLEGLSDEDEGENEGFKDDERQDEPQEFGFDQADTDFDLEAAASGGPRSIAKLLYSTAFQDALKEIEVYMGTERTTVMGPVEEDPEYKLLVKVNNLTVDIDGEISVLHKYVRDVYNKRFPELEQLILNPLDYLKTVSLIGMYLCVCVYKELQNE